MEVYLDLTKAQYLEFMQFDIDEKFQMLNLLKFVDKVPGTELSGIQQYMEYMKAVEQTLLKTLPKLVQKSTNWR